METSFFNFPFYAVPDPQIMFANLKGDNNRRLLIVLNTEDWEREQIFLNRIFNAAGVDLPKDGLILASEPMALKPSFAQIVGVHPIQYIFLFGVEPLELGVQADLPLHSPMVWRERTFFVSAPLKEVEQSTELKRPLWDFLRSEFLKK